jgi:hypothetical protein
MPQHFRIFLSSPGDVPNERALAIKVIDELPNEPSLKDRLTLEAVAWDKPGAPPMEAGLTPQEAINAGLSKPSDCDVVVVIFWSHMGTPLEYESVAYLSGTHYEYEEAMAASRANGKPRVLVYRRTDKVVFDADDPKVDEKQAQYQRVKDFFTSFTDPATGIITGGYNTYKTPDEFAGALKGHLLHLLERLAEVHLQAELDSLLAEFLNEDTKDYRRQAIIERWGEIGEGALLTLVSVFRDIIIKNGHLNDFESTFDVAFKTIPNAASVLIPTLNNKNIDLRRASIRVLGQLNNPIAVPYLLEALTHTEGEIKDAAKRALGQVNNPIAVPYLLEALTHPDAEVRFMAANVLGRLNDRIAVMPLIQCLSDERDGVRRAAAQALGSLNDPAAVLPLIECLDDPVDIVGSVAAKALGKLNDPRAVTPIVEYLNRRIFLIASEIAAALRSIGTPKTLAAVEQWEQEQKRKRGQS